jgi:hypothetical protein
MVCYGYTMTESRYYVHDRKVSDLQRFSAVNPRYWVMDRDANTYVDEFTTKRQAVLTTHALNQADRSARKEDS